MKLIKLSLLLLSQIGLAQVTTLSADGPGNTYELINSVLAPGYDVVETPDCIHPGTRHIEEVWDTQLNKYVFKFHIHVTPDNDRCIATDRQRTEIKTYNQSPDNLIGTLGETVIYKWKFKLHSAFQASNKFTHIHQIKAYGGDYESMPVVSFITRGGSTEKFQLMHSDSLVSTELASVNLSLFKGVWVEATETITYGVQGKYSLVIKRVNNNVVLMNYSNNNIRTWRTGAEGVRPKWGIYRSLLSPEQLRDEAIWFADFSIQEVNTASRDNTASIGEKLQLSPNPVNDTLYLNKNTVWDTISIISTQGNNVIEKKNYSTDSIDVSKLEPGVYIIRLSAEGKNWSEKFIKK